MHATSTRADGSLRYPNAGEAEDPWEMNREKFLRSLGIDPASVVFSGNTHGNQVLFLPLFKGELEGVTMQRIEGVDGLLTDLPNLALGVKTADCMPIFVVDPSKRTVGLFHAGWKGVEAGMPKAAVEAFTAHGSNQRDLLVAIGPSIRSCHYRRSLQDEAVEQLLTAGVPREHIDATAPCTACEQDKYFSYHLSKKSAESMLSVIAIHKNAVDKII